MAATGALAAAKTQAVAAYQALAKTARAVLPPTALPGLSLNKAMPQGTDAFSAAAGQLFTAVASIASLAEYGYDPAKLAAERAKITAYFEANNNQETAKTVAKAATAAQDAAVSALNKWLAQYIKVSRIAMRIQPTMLGRLGVTAAQRAASRKKTPALSKIEEPALSKVEEPAAPKS